MSAATPTFRKPALPNLNTSHGAGTHGTNSQISTPIQSATQSAVEGTFMLKRPELVKKEDYNTVKSLPNERQKEWRVHYGNACILQKGHEDAWKKLRLEISTGDAESMRSWRDVKQKHDVYYNKAEKEIYDFNRKISATNKKANDDSNFGYIDQIPLRYPCLAALKPLKEDTDMDSYDNEVTEEDKAAAKIAQAAGEAQWNSILENEDPEVVKTLRKYYSLGFLIQAYFNMRAEDPETFDMDVHGQLAKVLESFNDKISSGLSVLEDEYPDHYGALRIPSQEDTYMPLGGQNEYEEDTDETEDTPPLVPEDVEEISLNIRILRISIGGSDGLLSQVLQHLNTQYNVSDPTINTKWQEYLQTCHDEVTRSGHTPATKFDINLGRLKELRRQVEQADYKTDKARKEQNNSNLIRAITARDVKRKDVIEFINLLDYPHAFITAVAPSMFFSIYNPKPTVPSIARGSPSPEIIQKVKEAYRNSAGANGSLASELRELAAEKRTEWRHQDEVATAMRRFASAAGDFYGHEDLEQYTLYFGKMTSMSVQVKALIELRDASLKDGTDSRSSIIPLIQSIHAEYPFFADAIIGDLKPTELKTPTPIITSKKFTSRFDLPQTGVKTKNTSKQKGAKRGLRVIAAPSRDYTLEELITPSCKPGIISQIIDGVEIEKTIAHIRTFTKTFMIGGKATKVDIGYHILLRWFREGHDRATYEWTQGSKYKTAVADFKSLPLADKEWKTGLKEDLLGITLKTLKVGGVSFAPSKAGTMYENNRPCHIMFHNVDATKQQWKSKWFTITTARTAFGQGAVDALRAEFCRLSGQMLPEPVQTKKELRAELHEKILEAARASGARAGSKRSPFRSESKPKPVPKPTRRGDYRSRRVVESEDEGAGESLGETDTEEEEEEEEDEEDEEEEEDEEDEENDRENDFIGTETLDEEIEMIAAHLKHLRTKKGKASKGK